MTKRSFWGNSFTFCNGLLFTAIAIWSGPFGIYVFLAGAFSGFQDIAVSDFAARHSGGRVHEMCDNSKEAIMANGTVKWFNATKGFGFIQPEAGGADVFVHISAVERAGLRGLNDGQKVSYELATEKGKTSAVNLQTL